MGRPKGAKDRPGAKNRGRPKRVDLKKHLILSSEEVLKAKAGILELLSNGECMSISAAAKRLGLNPTKVVHWAFYDEDFAELIRLSKEVVADQLEDELAHHVNFIPKMMILKGLRPMYRDSYKFDVSNEKVEELLKELRKARETALLPNPPNVIDSTANEI